MSPVNPRNIEDSSRESNQRRSLHTQAQPQILVADDNDSTKWALEQLLESSGYEVIAVSDGSELLYELEPVILEEADSRPPDLIITDVRMPGINVFNIVEQLREIGFDTPVIIVTGYGSDRVRHRTHQLGRAVYFEKPVDIDRLEESVAALLA